MIGLSCRTKPLARCRRHGVAGGGGDSARQLRALSSRALRITSAMPAYHSAFPKDAPSVCGLAMLPLKTRARGPAVSLDATAAAGGDEDQIDEALRLFRANVLFRNFEVQGAPDRTLIYLTLLIHQVRAAGKRGARGGGSAGAARRWPFVAGSSSNGTPGRNLGADCACARRPPTKLRCCPLC
jgi:hypothetical protein